jgi:MFS family permease
VFWVAPLAGKLVDRIGERPFIVAGLALQATGMAWTALIAKTGLDYATMVAPMMIAGACVVAADAPLGVASAREARVSIVLHWRQWPLD